MRFDDLSDAERRYLAMHARYESQRQEDWRYQDADPEERHRLLTRWQEIADALHPNINDPTVVMEPATITDYQQLHALPEHQVVRDAAGRVWCVVKPKSEPGGTWLVPFSDEYAYIISTETSALGETPELPIVDLGVTSTGGG